MIIDFHTHAFPDKVAKVAVPKLSKQLVKPPITDGTLLGLKEKMKETNTDYFVLLNVASTPEQQAKANQFVIDANGGPILSFAAIHPLSKDYKYEIDKALDAGLKGVKFHPEYQSYDIDDKAAFDCYDYCFKKDLIMLFHGGYDVASGNSRRGYPDKSVNVAKAFPDAKIVLAHMGNPLDNKDAMKYLLDTNVYLDVSMAHFSMPPAQAKELIDALGPDKILYGTDCPWGTPSDTQSYLNSLNLSESELEKIYWKNAFSLLSL